jgi:hypothetical protein
MKRGNGMAAGNRGVTMTAPAPTAAETTWQKVDDATESLGTGMKSLAGTLRQQVPAGGTMGQMASGVAQTLEKTGSYLEQQGLSGASDDLQELVRTYPLQSLLISLGAGFLLSQICGGK